MTAVLPDDLYDLLDGRGLEGKIGHTILVTAAAPGDWPHTAFLSVGEIVAPSPASLRAVMYARSGTASAVVASGRALMLTVLRGVAYKLRVELSRAAAPTGPVPQGRLWLVGSVVDVQVDRADYATLLHGVTYELVDPAPVLARWRRQVHALQRMEGPG